MKSFKTIIKCAYCGVRTSKQTRLVNKRLSEGLPLFCSVSCSSKHMQALRHGKRVQEEGEGHSAEAN